MYLIPNDCKQILRTGTLNCDINRGTRKIKRLSSKEIYFTLQSNSTKYKKPFKFIPWPIFTEAHHILTPEI